ncbi:hypothetical protein CC2G_000497 [Coprinopsis cinerea AmutBmut pab1-1]|nr:hypothetical protein CC2G_000497 [Coprinopsis cinerea AmutBmut pab1-1]
MPSMLKWSTDYLKAAGLPIPQQEKGDYAVRRLLPGLPEVAGLLHENAIGPICRGIQGMVVGDIERTVLLLSELEERYEEGSVCEEEPEVNWDEKVIEEDDSMSRKRRHSSSAHSVYSKDPIIIPPLHPSIPYIVINHCGSQTHEEDVCRVPYQNSGFGQYLTVPTHPPFNQVHPPLLPTHAHTMMPIMEKWVWKNGHWEAVLPSLEEQTLRGLCSRPILNTRRKASRT